MTCPKAGDCDLQRYAADLGIRESSFGRKSFNYELNDKSPFITIDNNYCILCGRCVRVCKEQGTNVLDFMGRGITTKVSTAQDKPLHESGCTFCGSCVEACPVNTIMERDRWQHGREWDLEKADSVCTACASGCSVVVSKKNGRIVKVNTKESNGYICAIGRFGFDALTSANRITAPMKKQGNKLVPTTWEDASKIAADALKKAGDSAGFIVAGSLTNEEAAALELLARDVVGSPNISTPAAAYAGGAIAALRAVYGDNGIAIATKADLAAADCVVVIGADPSQKGQSLQEVDVMIRRRAQAGAKIIIVNPDTIGLTAHANAIHLGLKPGTDTALLAGLMSAALAEGLTTKQKEFDAFKKGLLTADQASSVSGVSVEKIAEAAKAYAAAKQPVVIFGTGISASEDASLQALNLANLKNAGVMPLLLEANALGVMQMGCLSDLGPGFTAIKKTGKKYGAMKSGMGALFVAGNVPDGDFKAGTLIVQASHANALTEKADLVLPMTALYEKQGTIISTYGQQKVFAQAQPAAGDAKDGAEIAESISAAVSKTKAISAKDVSSLVKKAKAGKIGAGSLTSVKTEAAKPYGISTTMLLLAMNQGLLSGSAVIKVIEVKQPVLQK
jgi:predicted molibdopterin-dependent oxidoreductase YjgC